MICNFVQIRSPVEAPLAHHFPHGLRQLLVGNRRLSANHEPNSTHVALRF